MERLPFTAWELEVMAKALLNYAKFPAWSALSRKQMRNLSKRLQEADPN